jgi:heme A synthase
MRWLKPLALVVFVAASLGGLASLYVAVGSWLGRYPKMANHPEVLLLFFGVFVVWFPAVVMLRRVTRGSMSRNRMKLALSHASPLIRGLVHAAWIYCVLVWAVTLIIHFVKKTPTPANEGVYFTAFMLVFYATAAGVSASVLAMTPEQLDPHCANGHAVGVEARFCEACGAPVGGTVAGSA